MQAARREMPDLPTRWRSGRLRTTSVGEIASWTWAGPRLSHEYFEKIRPPAWTLPGATCWPSLIWVSVLGANAATPAPRLKRA